MKYLIGDTCGCDASNLNDELQCMACGTYNDGLEEFDTEEEKAIIDLENERQDFLNKKN